MICAIYARRSQEQNGLANEAKSVQRQIDNARAYATRKGWRVAEEHIYSDDGISGAEFKTRPGYLRLMNALTPRPPFQALIMSEESRLGREQIETSYALKQLVTAGVRVFFYLEDKERTLDSPTDKLLLSVSGFASEVEREKARQRTADAMLRKARAGHATGGRTFGYDHREVLAADGRRSHVERVVNPTEAEVVRRLFELAASGAGFKRIADRLNREGAIAPPPRRAGRPRGWAASTVRECLYRDVYRGVIVWNKVQKRNAWGLKTYAARPESEWLTLHAPALRIVTDEAWQAAHARLAQSRDAYIRTNGGRLFGRPANGVESHYLLTGLLACGLCGAGFVVVSRDMKRYRKHSYACGGNRHRGAAICPNNLRVPLDVADRGILDTIERDLLTPEILDAALEEALAGLLPTSERAEQRRETLVAEQSRLEAELGRLTEAIVAGGDAATLVAAIRTREKRKAEVVSALAVLGHVRQMDAHQLAALRADLKARLSDWRSLLRRQPIQGRQILRKLLVGRLTLTPREADGRRVYEYRGEATLGRLLAGAIPSAPGMVTPAGFEPAISTLKGSRPRPG